MLTKQRRELLLKILEEQGSVTVTELKEMLDASEATIRRDITSLDQEGKLEKVFGGALAVEQKVMAHEYTVAQKRELNLQEKRKIAKYAAALIAEEDFVYLDAGTTTAHMLEFIRQSNATFVTNAVAHAQNLAARGMKVFLIGGELKASTEAVVGSQAMQTLLNYHFTKGFFGTNGVTRQSGCTTPDSNEALIKRVAMNQCKKCYILCDSTKFGNVSPVTFADFYKPVFLTEKQIAGYEDCENIIAVKED